MKQQNVLQIMNYAAAYEGNFIAGIKALERLTKQNGSDTVYLFPAATAQRPWATALLSGGAAVYFMPPSFFGRVQMLRRIIKCHEISLIHSHFINRAEYLPLRVATLFGNIPHIFHAHSLPHTSEGRVKNAVKRFLMNARVTICVSESVREKYERLGFNCVTIENGIDFSRLDMCETARNRSTKNVLMFGYNVEIKGIDTAARAFERFNTDGSLTLSICVASHMPQVRQTLTALMGEIPPWLRLLPPTQNVADYYGDADIFLSASRTEGMPYAVCEAAYSRLPLVLSDIPQHTSLKIPGTDYFPVSDGQELWNAVLRATHTARDSAASSLEHAHDYVESQFSLDKWANRVFKIYNNIDTGVNASE